MEAFQLAIIHSAGIYRCPMPPAFHRTIAALWLAAVLLPCAAAPGENARAELHQFLPTILADPSVRYASAFSDLDGDGTAEALVYVSSADYCGSGGCPTLVLKKQAQNWAVVTKIEITRLPVRLLGSANGWRSIGVRVGGGGIRPGYEAELRFDGKTYPANPTVPPARRSARNSAGIVVIPVSPQWIELGSH